MLLWRTLRAHFAEIGQRRTANRKSRSCSYFQRAIGPVLEPLESRILLSWIGATSGSTNDSAHSYTNTANWSGGTINDSFAGVTLSGNTTIYLSSARTTSSTGLNLNYSGNYNFTIESSSTTTETLTIHGGITDSLGGTSRTITLGNSTDPLAISLDSATQTLSVSSGDQLAIVGVVSSGGLNLSGAGTVILSGANTYSSGTTISAGILDVNNAKAIGTGTFTIDGGSIDNTSGGSITLSNNNAQTWGGNFTFVGSNPLNLGTGAVTLSAARTVTISGSTLTVGGVVSGSYSLTKAGSGTLVLSGANTFTGGTTLSAGQLDINNAKAIGTGTLTIDGGSIDNTSSGSITLSNNNAQTWDGDFTFVGSHALNLGTGAVTLGSNRNVTVSGSTLTVGGVISGAYGITKAGSGTLVVNGADTYGGATTINAGVVELGNTNAAQDSTVFVDVNGGLIFASGVTAITLGELAGTGNLSLVNAGSSAVALTEGGNGSTGTYSGVLSGSGSLKVNGGTLSLSGVNTFTGGTTISSGTLFATNSSGSATGTGSVAVSSGGALGGSGTISGAVSVSSGGTLSPGAGSSTAILSTGGLTLSSGATLDAVINGTTVGSGYDQISVSGNATISGSTLTLAGTNTSHNGSPLTILQVSGNETGTFAGLGQGGTVNSNGVTYTVSYSGGSGHNIVLTADVAASTTTLASLVNPSVYGQSVTFTATVTSGSSGTPTGTVTFMDGSTELGNGTLNASAQATFTTSSLDVAGHSITAVYGGDSNFASSTSSALDDSVDQDSSNTVESLSDNTVVFGETDTITATVTAVAPGAGTPTGTVTFSDGSTTLGTSTLDASGVATFNSSNFTIGTNSITAAYNGDSNFLTRTSSASPLTVDQDSTTSTLSSSVNPSVLNQGTVITATVTANSPGSGTPTGTATFFDGGAELGSGSLNSSGEATLSVSGLALGSHSITVSYSGDGNFTSSTSTPLDQTVNPDATTTALTLSPDPTTSGQDVTLAAAVSVNSPGSGTPSGTVTFYDGSTALGTSGLNGSAQATLSDFTFSQGNHSITAVYNGSTDYAGSTSAPSTESINLASTNTSISSSAGQIVYGQSITYIAKVAPTSSNANFPTGTVMFMDGSTELGTATINSLGYADFTSSNLVVGSHSIAAVYAGDANFATSTSSSSGLTVNRDSSSVSLGSSSLSAILDQSVTFTATVTALSPGAGTPTATVTFYDGSNSLGSGNLNGSGVATLTTSSLNVGNHSISASYSGDTNFANSNSYSISQVIVQCATTTLVVASSNPAATGQSVTFSATVTPNSDVSPTPTGSVEFLDGSTQLGSGSLNGSGQAMFTTSNLALGDQSITAVYTGDSNFSASSSSTLAETVTLPAPAVPTNLSASALGSNEIDLSWTDNTQGTAQYVVERATGTGGTFDQVALLDPGTTAFSDTDLTAGTTYQYQVYATDSGGNSSAAETSESLPVSANSTSYVTSFASGTLRNDYNGWVGYEFTTGSFSLTITALGRLVQSGNTQSHELALIDASSGDTVATVTVDTSGATAGQIEYASLTTQVTLLPNHEYYLVSQETSGGDDWSDKNATFTDIGNNVAVADGPANGDSLSDVGSSNGNSPSQNAFVVLDFQYATVLPTAPANLTATPATASVTLNWTDSASDEAGFEIQRKTGSSGSYNTVGNVAAGVLQYTDTSAVPGTDYYYRVLAYNVAGDSTYTSEVSATANAASLPFTDSFCAPTAPASDHSG